MEQILGGGLDANSAIFGALQNACKDRDGFGGQNGMMFLIFIVLLGLGRNGGLLGGCGTTAGAGVCQDLLTILNAINAVKDTTVATSAQTQQVVAANADRTVASLTSGFNTLTADLTNQNNQLSRDILSQTSELKSGLTSQTAYMTSAFADQERATVAGFTGVKDYLCQINQNLGNKMDAGFNDTKSAIACSTNTVTQSMNNGFTALAGMTKDGFCQMDRSIERTNCNMNTQFANVNCKLDGLKQEVANSTASIMAYMDKQALITENKRQAEIIEELRHKSRHYDSIIAGNNVGSGNMNIKEMLQIFEYMSRGNGNGNGKPSSM